MIKKLYGTLKLLYRLFGEPKFAIYYIILMLFSVINGFFEVIGIIIIFPMVTLILDPNVINTPHTFFHWSYNHFHFLSTQTYILAFGLSILTIMLCRNIFTMMFSYWNAIYIGKTKNRIANLMFRYFINLPYAQSVKTSVDHKSSHVATISNEASENVVGVSLSLFANTFFTILIVSILLAIFKMVLVIPVLFILVMGYLQVKLMRRKRTEVGVSLIDYNSLHKSFLSEGLRNLKQIKTLGVTKFFLTRFKKVNIKALNMQLFIDATKISAPYVSETLILIAVVLVFLGLYLDGNAGDMLPFLGLLSIATFRLATLFNSIMREYFTISQGVAAMDYVLIPMKDDIEFVLKDVKSKKHNDNNMNLIKISNLEDSIELKNVGVIFNKIFPALNNINLTIKKNSYIGVVGHTGSGKSTLISLILGLYLDEDRTKKNEFMIKRLSKVDKSVDKLEQVKALNNNGIIKKVFEKNLQLLLTQHANSLHNTEGISNVIAEYVSQNYLQILLSTGNQQLNTYLKTLSAEDIDDVVNNSTIVKGDILIDGVNIQNIELSSYLSLFAFVPQKISLFAKTLAENIAIGSIDGIDRNRIEDILKLVRLWDKVEQLANGIDTVIDPEAPEFSIGQIQRIGIARALYLDRPILVLDEATSALDVQTEHILIQLFNELCKTKTIIAIAHRLNTLKYCNNLIYLEHGHVKGVGTFDELRTTLPSFNELVSHTENNGLIEE